MVVLGPPGLGPPTALHPPGGPGSPPGARSLPGVPRGAARWGPAGCSRPAPRAPKRQQRDGGAPRSPTQSPGKRADLAKPLAARPPPACASAKRGRLRLSGARQEKSALGKQNLSRKAATGPGRTPAPRGANQPWQHAAGPGPLAEHGRESGRRAAGAAAEPRHTARRWHQPGTTHAAGAGVGAIITCPFALRRAPGSGGSVTPPGAAPAPPATQLSTRRASSPAPTPNRGEGGDGDRHAGTCQGHAETPALLPRVQGGYTKRLERRTCNSLFIVLFLFFSPFSP